MKKNISDVKGVLSSAAIVALMSLPSFAQEVEFNKGTMDWRDTLEIQKEVKERLAKKRDKVEPVSVLKPVGIKGLDPGFNITDDKVKREKVETVSTLKPAGIKNLDPKIDAELLDKKVEVKREKIEPLSTLKPIGIKELKTEITAELLTDKVQLKRAEVKPVSTLKAQGVKLLGDTEIKAELLLDKNAVVKVEEKEVTEKEEGVLSREESLERYICQKESQLKKLEERFTSFEKTITESTLAMQTAISQIAMFNQQNQSINQISRAPSVYDRYDQMYPMMMMQSMQNQMMMQNMNYNYTQSMNTMFMSQAMTYGMMAGMNSSNNYAYGADNLQNKYGQNIDAHFNGKSGLTADTNNNLIPNFNQSRSFVPHNQNWSTISATQHINDFSKTANGKTDGTPFIGPVLEEKEVETTETVTTETVTKTKDGLS